MAFFNEFPGNRFYDGDLGWLMRRMHDIISGKFADVHSLHVTDDDGNTILQAPNGAGITEANELQLQSYPAREIGAEVADLARVRDHTYYQTIEDAGEVEGLTAECYLQAGTVELDIMTPVAGLDAPLQTSGGYITFYLDPRMRPVHDIFMNVLISARYTAQLNIREATGLVQIGYTRNISDGNPVNIPASTFIRTHVSYVSGYNQTMEPV